MPEGLHLKMLPITLKEFRVKYIDPKIPTISELRDGYTQYLDDNEFQHHYGKMTKDEWDDYQFDTLILPDNLMDRRWKDKL